jgi:hypothetical protein
MIDLNGLENVHKKKGGIARLVNLFNGKAGYDVDTLITH